MGFIANSWMPLDKMVYSDISTRGKALLSRILLLPVFVPIPLLYTLWLICDFSCLIYKNTTRTLLFILKSYWENDKRIVSVKGSICIIISCYSIPLISVTQPFSQPLQPLSFSCYFLPHWVQAYPLSLLFSHFHSLIFLDNDILSIVIHIPTHLPPLMHKIDLIGHSLIMSLLGSFKNSTEFRIALMAQCNSYVIYIF